ncbi:hypothetical protein V8C44DRAFT_367514 [Trichoderma aethiopicum]
MPLDDDCTSSSIFLLAISNASSARRQRHQQGTQQSLLLKYDNQGEDVCKATAQLRSFKSPSSSSSSSSEEEDRQTISKITNLHKKTLEQYHMHRYKASLTNTLSRTHLDDAVLHLLLTQPPSEEDHYKTLSDKILALWNANQARIRASLPRYVEGYPVRDRIQPPRFGPRRRMKPSGLGDCLQCLAKGLPCSMGVRATGEEGDGLRGGCRRCVADGERCIIEHEEVHEDANDDGDAEEDKVRMTGDGKGREEEESGLWDWWDGVPDRDQGVDSAAEAIEMWERRRKGMKLELIGGRMLWVEFRGFAPRGMTETSF